MKKTLCALIFGISSVIGCDTLETEQIGTEQHKKAIYVQKEKIVYIPNECKEVKSLTQVYHYLELTCLNDAGETNYYSRVGLDNAWTKYILIKEDKK